MRLLVSELYIYIRMQGVTIKKSDDGFSKKPKHVASIKSDINADVTDGLNFHFSVPLSQLDVILKVYVY